MLWERRLGTALVNLKLTRNWSTNKTCMRSQGQCKPPKNALLFRARHDIKPWCFSAVMRAVLLASFNETHWGVEYWLVHNIFHTHYPLSLIGSCSSGQNLFGHTWSQIGKQVKPPTPPLVPIIWNRFQARFVTYLSYMYILYMHVTTSVRPSIYLSICIHDFPVIHSVMIMGLYDQL